MSINPLHWTPALLRIRMNLKGCVLAVAREGGRYCDTRSQVCTTERHQEGMIQS